MMAVLPGFPLLPDSDDDENVVDLPTGQLVCCRHALVTCGKCRVDFSFMAEENDSDDHNQDTEDVHWDLCCADDRAELTARRGGPPTNRRTGAHASPSSSSSQSNARSSNWPHSRTPYETIVAQTHPSTLHKRRGTGRVIPTRFVPPSASTTPLELFRGVHRYAHFARYVHRHDSKKGLIFTDGACLDNGKSNPRAGWAFICGPPNFRPGFFVNVVSGRLEKKGPFGDEGPQASNRAELRAVLGALLFRHWPGEGFNTIVFATDSEYVVEGATKWARGWIENGWKTTRGEPVKNKDLWEMLLGEAEKYKDWGVEIQFWKINRDLNGVADQAAKEAATSMVLRDDYTDVIGI